MDDRETRLTDEAFVNHIAVCMFWKSEHLDPQEISDVPEHEWFGDAFPSAMSDRARDFWLILARYVIADVEARTLRSVGPPREMVTMVRKLMGPYILTDAGEDTNYFSSAKTDCEILASAFTALRSQTLDEAARVADDPALEEPTLTGRQIAARIRAL